jgi:hypothetical protein
LDGRFQSGYVFCIPYNELVLIWKGAKVNLKYLGDCPTVYDIMICPRDFDTVLGLSVLPQGLWMAPFTFIVYFAIAVLQEATLSVPRSIPVL